MSHTCHCGGKLKLIDIQGTKTGVYQCQNCDEIKVKKVK